MKKVHSFRLSEETLKKLDKVIEFENGNLERKGLLVFEYTRTNMIELLIDIAYSLSKKGQSVQDVKILIKEMMKND